MSQGWIKLHRRIKESVIYSNHVALHCWVECLLRASHTSKSVFLKREKIDLKPGMFVMGREEFGASVGVSGSTAWYWLLQFEADSRVDIKKTVKGSVVTIKNWVEDQGVDSTVDNKKTTDEQQMNTNKNVKNVKNVKKEDADASEQDFSFGSIHSIDQAVLRQLADKHDTAIATVTSCWDDAKNWLLANGKRKKNYKAFLENWLKRDLARERRNKPTGAFII